MNTPLLYIHKAGSIGLNWVILQVFCTYVYVNRSDSRRPLKGFPLYGLLYVAVCTSVAGNAVFVGGIYHVQYVGETSHMECVSLLMCLHF